jgi:hypothetical protein
VIEAGTAFDAVRAFLAAARDGLLTGDYRQSCPIAGVALDLTHSDDVLAGRVSDAFDAAVEELVAHVAAALPAA